MKGIPAFSQLLRRLPPARKLLSNFLSLGAVRATEALVLLVLSPVLIRRLGIDSFGVLALALVVFGYARSIIDYGFNISGVRETAVARENPLRLAQLLWTSIYTRLLLAAILAGLLGLLMVFVPFFQTYRLVFIGGLPLLAAYACSADWFFLGLQQTRFVAAANLVARMAYVVLVVLLIFRPEQLGLVLAFNGATALLANLVLLAYLQTRRLNLPLPGPDQREIARWLYSDFRLLLSNLAIEINSTFPLVALGLLSTEAVTGYFSLMQKLVQPLRFLLVMFSQTIFPVVCETVYAGKLNAARRQLRRLTLLFAPAPILGSAFLMLFAQPVLQFFAPDFPAEFLPLFRWYLLLPLVILLNIPAYQILLALDQKQGYTRIYLISLLLNLCLCLLLTEWMGLQGLIAAVLLVETLITLGLWTLERSLNNKNE